MTSVDRKFWAGATPPDSSWTASEAIFDSIAGYRAPPEFHGTCSAVNLTAVDLSTKKAWAVILDEALRLMTPQGTLTLRASNTRLVSVFELMRRIWSWSRGSVVLEAQSIEGESFTICLKFDVEPRSPSLLSFDFVILTDGQQPEKVDRFIDSVRAAVKGKVIYSIKVACSESINYTKFCSWGSDCDLLLELGSDPKTFTRRKNLAIRSCDSENVVIVHDRYSISRNFLEAVSDFGADFSVVICRQKLLDGGRFPDLVCVGSDVVTTSAGILDHDDWSIGVYVNGGAVLAKRTVLLQIPWNELLLWGQFEDVEWTRRLRDAGLEPRFARHVTLITSPPRDGYLASFESLAIAPAQYLLPGWSGEANAVARPTISGPGLRRLTGRDGGFVAMRTGVSLTGGWDISPHGSHKSAARSAGLLFRLHRPVEAGLTWLGLFGDLRGLSLMIEGQALRLFALGPIAVTSLRPEQMRDGCVASLFLDKGASIRLTMLAVFHPSMLRATWITRLLRRLMRRLGGGRV